MNPKELKKEIKRLTKLKRACRSGTKERIELYRNIKELKTQLVELTKPDEAKQKIIAEILALDKLMASIEIDLTKHNIEDLQRYLKKLKNKFDNH